MKTMRDDDDKTRESKADPPPSEGRRARGKRPSRMGKVRARPRKKSSSRKGGARSRSSRPAPAPAPMMPPAAAPEPAPLIPQPTIDRPVHEEQRPDQPPPPSAQSFCSHMGYYEGGDANALHEYVP